MNNTIYKIEALTNMHVGSGDANYGVIDNLVQRDVVTNLPTINGSSLKGALKEFFENEWSTNDNKIKHIFGSNDNNAAYKFLSANLLAIPVRSNKKAYFLATAPMIINKLKEDADNFGFELDLSVFDDLKPEKGRPIIFKNYGNDLIIEDFTNFQEVSKNANTLLGNLENLVFLNNEDFLELTDDFHLPVIARNKVGENKNLWYEQVVPAKSLFYFIVLHDNNYYNDFNNVLTGDKKTIHIGANASVGYGFTKISKL